VKTILLARCAAIAFATAANAKNEQDIATRAEFWRVFHNAQQHATVQVDEGYYHNWKGDGFRARTWNADGSRNYSDLCLDNSGTERTCYDSDGKKWKMLFGANKIYPNEWSPDVYLRKYFVGETAPDLFAK
jgi:hypothetical protein